MTFFLFFIYELYIQRRPRSVMVNALNSDIVANEFEQQSYCYINFPTNTLGLNSTNKVLL